MAEAAVVASATDGWDYNPLQAVNPGQGCGLALVKRRDAHEPAYAAHDPDGARLASISRIFDRMRWRMFLNAANSLTP